MKDDGYVSGSRPIYYKCTKITFRLFFLCFFFSNIFQYIISSLITNFCTEKAVIIDICMMLHKNVGLNFSMNLKMLNCIHTSNDDFCVTVTVT